MNKYKILHLEDNVNDSELLQFVLQNGGLKYDYKRVDNKNDYVKELSSGIYDIVIADYSLPLYSGYQALELARQYNPHIPFIFVSGTLGEENAISMLKQGASDYLLKGNLKRLISAIEHSINESNTKVEKIKAEEKLRDSLKEKELLLREIHHRVKNNLQIISSLVKLQAVSQKNKETQDILLETNNRIMAMSIIHQKLYQSVNISKVNFEEYPKSLMSYLSNIYSDKKSNIRFNVNVDNVNLDVDTSVPCGLLMNEIITNSLKHAFDERGGEINLEMKKHNDNKYYLIISDNGKGLGFDFDEYSGDTLGVQLIRALVNQLDGNLEIDSSMGTKYSISFNRLKYSERT
jgi:two-component sensor histidine kinase